MKHSKKNLYENTIFNLAILLGLGIQTVMAQHGILSSGGDNTGSTGSISFSIGQAFFNTILGSTGTVSQGLQQPPMNESELPVTLSLFEVTAMNHEQVLVHWETQDEFNNDFFTVERSNNGFTFEEITRLKTSGNSDISKKYSWTDFNPHTGMSYYRLKQTDFDQTSTYSTIKAVRINPYLHAIEVYPNPVNDYLNIKLKADYEKNQFYKLFDLNGRLIQNEELSHDIQSIDMAGLQPAIYLLHLGNGSEFKEFKIIKN